MTRTEQIYSKYESEASGHQRDWDRAERYAEIEAEEKATAQAEKARKSALWNQYKADLRAAGVSDVAMKTLASSDSEIFHQLPAYIAVGQIAFSSPEKEQAVKAAIRKLWLALEYGEPDFRRETYTKQTYVRWDI